MKQIIVISYFILSQFICAQKTILWKITNKINNKESVIVGTYHQMGNSFVDSIPLIKESLYKSELAIFESIDKPETVFKIINARESSNEVEKSLKKKDLKYLLEISKNWKANIHKLTPVELTYKLNQDFLKQKCNSIKLTDTWNHFDRYLQFLASEKKTKMVGLETDSLQLKSIQSENKNFDWKTESKKIHFWVEQLKSENPTQTPCELVNKYKEFDLDYEFHSQCENGMMTIIKQRNDNWMKLIPKLIKTKNCFIAVGYLHLKNKCGILEQLKEFGFIVEPIELKASR